ncbi:MULTISPECIES: hypothetical protein [Streptomyces]|uniref:PH domain-containing protein n=1 Tax=Streptomyces lonegramiae TaxID=3075524 RepID=A0ABU2XMQ1_9ACTN|nr:hypothetical protein [Streptomyces sp. DSM 41529]MDT0547171.1 hypothetical protein [Streptomyces sp. DSM 41529]
MPLPFLTADRALDDEGPEAGAALPYEDPGRRRRPYRPGPWRVGGAALLLLLASYVLFSAMIIALAGSVPAAGVCVAVAALVIVCAVRLVRAGVWMDEEGLRLTGLFSATTMRWSQITAIRTTQQPVRWLGLPRSVQGQAVLIEVAGGSSPRVAVTDHSADFLGRPESFAMAADAIEGSAARYR